MQTTTLEAELQVTAQLARFFASIRRVHVNAFLSLQRTAQPNAGEAVVIEYAGEGRAIFKSGLPVDFGERICLRNSSGQQNDAKVIAMQYQDGSTAVAAQILNGQLSWMERP